MQSLAIRAHQKNLNLVCNVDAEVPEVVTGDLGRLRQIIVNLVGNAIKFTEAGVISLNVCVVSQTPDEVELKFEVCDTGVGVTETRK